MILTIRTRILPNTGSYEDPGDSSSDEGILTPTSSADSSSDEMAHDAFPPLLSSAAPMARVDKAPSSTASIPTSTASPEDDQRGIATPRPSYGLRPAGLIPLYPLYPVLPITGDQAGMLDDLTSGPAGTPGPFYQHTPNFTIPRASYTYIAPANSGTPSSWVSSNNQSTWNTDGGEEDIEVGEFMSRTQRQQELLEMEQIEAAIAASRADLPDFVACSKEQERVMMAYAEDSSIPRPRLETKEDEEFFAELLPTEIVAEDEDMEYGNSDDDDVEMT